jgi:energy-coupling factor transporter ATP-binding protein EcfA2
MGGNNPAACGVTATFWFSSGIDWPSLRGVLAAWGAPRSLLRQADMALAGGLILLQELERRQMALTLRLGQPLERNLAGYGRNFGLLLAATLEGAYYRALRQQEARSLRLVDSEPALEAPSPESDSAWVVALESLTLRFKNDSGDVIPESGLSQVSFQLAPSEWVAVLGPSGSGKTTLLRTIAGLEEPTSGKLHRFGVPVRARGLRPDPRLAFVSQDPLDQLLGATPEADLLWGLSERGLEPEPALEKTLALLEMMGIASLAHRPIARMSHGERKRAAFASALSVQPALLLCDEPTSGLDARAAHQLMQAVSTTASQEMALLWVTHDWLYLPQRVERVIHLQDGRIVFDGSREEGLSRERLRASGLLAEATNRP